MTAIPSIAEASAAIAAGQLSPVDLVEACIERVEAFDGMLNSFILVLADQARAEAKVAEAEIRSYGQKSPLHGIPIGIKDIFDVGGVPTTAHSRRLIDNIAVTDAHSVAGLRAAGAIVLGKLATHEFALGGPSFDLPFPPARNPWDAQRFTGGSSSGSGAAVAAGLVLGATGSDTGGSIRVPASFCGLAGLKPTYGLVSRRGIFPLSWSLDHGGPMAWTAKDCALMLSAMVGTDAMDPGSAGRATQDYAGGIERDLTGLRIGIIRHFHERDNVCSPEMIASIADVERILAVRGASVGTVTLSPLDDYVACGHAIMLTEGFSVHGDDLAARPTIYGEAFRDRMSMGALFTATDYLQALRIRRGLCAEMAAAFVDYDILVTAAAPAEAPMLDKVSKFASYDRPALSLPFNVTGVPTLVVRCGKGPAGLPLGVQFAARPFEEGLLLAAGHACESELGERTLRPPLVVPVMEGA
ncbi:amidase [Agrobacterium rosae]|uniref:Indoleacetamide hydrolase n=1 Tax=Agrobacterium rosae TaxID=1972867 RepID=A0AAW9FIW6_9HYPH|nr:amidase [Agrobacterium rosae]MDX8304388.1 amidase [Agrobacterium rosae]